MLIMIKAWVRFVKRDDTRGLDRKHLVVIPARQPESRVDPVVIPARQHPPGYLLFAGPAK
jgi:hypothetical protein